MPFDFKITIPQTALPVFEDSLSEVAGAVLTRLLEKGPKAGLWELQAIFEEKPDTKNIKQILSYAAQQTQIKTPCCHIKQMPDINWLEASYQGFPPISVGNYFIYGSHITETLPTDKITLKIDAATAFGTGEHQTTHGCLQALNDLEKIPETVLDVGCGSGILGMAFAKTYQKKVDAVDIDPESVRVTIDNAKNNGLDDLLTVWQSDGYKKVENKYDLIFCNILAQPLIDMANDLSNHLKKGGIAILSGFLNNQENWVKKAHLEVGLTFVKHYRINGWSTLVMIKD